MSDIAIIGEREVIWGFQALGLPVYEAREREDAQAILHQLLRQGVTLIFITETLAQQVQEFLGQLSPRITSIVSVLPHPGKRIFWPEEQLRNRIKKAIGIDIYRRGNEQR